MKSQTKIRTKGSSRGFTLVVSLLLLLLMSGIAIGLLTMVNTENTAGGNDLQNNLAYRSAEGAIEKMTSDIATTFSNIQSPTAAQITGLSALMPTGDPNVSYPDYSLTPRLNPDGTLNTSYQPIHSGPYQGLYAQLLQVDLRATAQRATLGKEEVTMQRTVEVALIPVFQFGVFSDSDLSFFSSPDLDFAGRVHTNGDLYLGVANSNTLTFHDKITAYGNVIRKLMPNGLDATASGNNDSGTVKILTASGGCDGSQSACRSLAMTEGSVVNGPTSAYNSGPPSWQTISLGTYSGWMLDGDYGNTTLGTGVKQLNLPFVTGASKPYEIIRRSPKNGAAATAADPSRLATQAEIRVLLGDICTDNHLIGWNGDATQDVVLDSTAFGGVGTAVTGTAGGNSFFAIANNSSAYKNPTNNHNVEYDTDFVVPPVPAANPWPLIGGCLTVEVKETDGLWHGVTKNWLTLGFARGLAVPTAPAPAAGSNGVHPNAILIFQETADRDDSGTLNGANEPTTAASLVGSDSQFNFLPINLYDAREGENWDSTGGLTINTCTPNGVMNAVELDVGNLRNWLLNNVTGKLVDYTSQNGYIVYFSDRRGMQGDPNNAGQIMGEYGFEDTINLANSGVPNGAAEPIPSGKTYSPEDVNENGTLDLYGVKHVGDGFGSTYATDTNTASPATPFAHRMACITTARKNRVTGARHVLKLVDGSLGRLPTQPAGTGGFTVGSENPVYIQGDYNTSAADPTWTNTGATEPAHAAAAVIADAVTLLSNSWKDAGTSSTPGSLHDEAQDPTVRNATTTYYRVAIAAGKNKAFPNTSSNPTWVFGTDGGLHNFLRFLEDWSNQTLNYKGSLVSLYYSTYATGTFKCCNLVYHPPTRNYIFDPLFASPQNLPPGTPMFQDIDNLSYRQDFTGRTY